MSPTPRVAEVFSRVRGHLVGRLRRAGILLALAAALVVLLVAWLAAGADGWTGGTQGPLVLDLALLVALAALWLASRRVATRWLTERRVAGSMEKAAGLDEGTVLGALEVGRALPPGVSGSLAALAEQGVARRLGLPAERLAGGAGATVATWSRSAYRVLAVLAPLVLVAALLSPGRSRTAWLGLATPFRLLAAPVLPALGVEPGDVEVLRGSDLGVRVRAPGRTEVGLHWQAAGDVPREEGADVDGDRARFTLHDVRVPIEYWIAAPDGARSPTYRVTPVDPLFVTDVRLELAFPPHTGRAPEEYRGDVPPLTLPVGSRIRIEGRASRPLGTAGLVQAGGDAAVDLSVEGAAFSSTWWPGRSGLWEWTFTDAEGGVAEAVPTPLDITLVADSVPTVRITFPGQDTVLPMGHRQPLVIEATDDYGVSTLELVAYRVTSLGERLDPSTLTIELGANRGVLARPLLDVSGWGLLPGDTVRYYARAVDNGPGAQAATSREYSLWLPGASELRREAQRQMEDASQDVEELAERTGDEARETRDLERQTQSARSADRSGAEQGREERVDFQQREDVGQALTRQEELQAAIDSVRSRLEQLSEAMREAGASDPDLAKDLEELQNLLAEALTPEMRQQLSEQQSRIDQMDAAEATSTLDQLREQQESIRERLQEALGRFQRAAVEQDFRATTQEAEDLAVEERALADAMREEDRLEERAEQQAELHDRAEEMEGHMEGLEQKLEQLGEADAAGEVGEALQDAQRAQAEMQQAGQSARQGEGQQAGARADQAAGALSETAQRLEEARRSQAQERAAAMESALRRAADDALSLARREAEIGESMAGASREQLAEMRGDVAAVQEGVRNIADNLAATGGRSGADRALSTLLGRAMQALDGTVQALETRVGATSGSAAASVEAVGALNDLALVAMSGADQMAQGQSAGAQQDLQQQLESLAQQQGQLNNQAGQLMPLQLGQQAMQNQMQQLAEGQQGVADELGQVANQPGGDGALGDLKALAQEAQELAQELAGGRLEAPTRERQERLFHRLLDAGRSLEKEEFSDERESTAPGAFERGQVVPLSADALDAVRFRLPGSGALQRLSPAERRLVLQYFERLNREEGRAESGTAGGGGR